MIKDTKNPRNTARSSKRRKGCKRLKTIGERGWIRTSDPLRLSAFARRSAPSNQVHLAVSGLTRKARVGKAQNGLSFFRRHIKNFGYLINRHTGLKIFEHRLNRHPGPTEDPPAANLAGDALHSRTL